MSGFSTLNIGASGLYATQRAVEVASQNIANASVDGYSRQRVNATAATPTPGNSVANHDGMVGNGVTITSVSRIHDVLADVNYRSETAADGYAGARASVLDQAQGVLGSVDSGASAALDAFWSSFNTLATSPTNMAARESVLGAGAELARSLNDASAQLAAVTRTAASKVSGDVDSINNLAAQVGKLNQAILAASSSGQSPNDLMDSRDRALDSLSQLAGVQLNTRGNGMVDVFLGSTSLVRGPDSYPLTAGTNAAGAPTVAFADGTPATPGGEIGGYLSVTTVEVPGLSAQLDAIANGLISAVNAVHSAGTGLDGSTGVAFFTGSGAGTIAVNPALSAQKLAASAGGSANDGNNAAELFQLRTSPAAVSLAGGGTSTVGDALTSLAGRLGSLAAGSAQVRNATSSALDSATKSRASTNGVSVDEEMVDLVKYQHAYSAAAKVISTADAMLDTLINRLGA
jgi:flagellar hook-associated protein 1 FlgK